MTFQPVVPFSGIAGWLVLQRTRDDQQAAFHASPAIERDTAYFAEKIGEIDSPQALVDDYRLLKVTLGAFGLDEDLPNKFFIRKILEEGTIAPDSLANKLADKRYFELAKAFSFDLTPANNVLSTFADETIAAYKDRQFEVAIGNSDTSMRLALGVEREIEALAAKDISEDGLWFSVMAAPPLRAVFDAAFGFPREIATIDIDRQLDLYKERADALFGSDSLRQFADPDKQEELVRRYLVNADSGSAFSSTAPGASALALLQASATVSLF